ncbi:serine hydrolase domain-containing protein [Nocardia sp. NPDC052566]|uniref:serine hydrolase domain-containing protein n=1 Tax=Nocardia sp. NPDC052566 TaxID=3364330 RepID=UPI0037C8751B
MITPRRRSTAAALLSALAVALLAVAVPAGAAPDPRGIDPAAVDRFMADYLSRTGLPGAAVAITRGTEVIHIAGYGHDSTGAAVTATTRMPIASLSKSMTALAVLQLVDAGRVDLDAPVRRYLTDFSTADPRGERITVRQLLNQTSGMSDTAFPDLRRPQAHSLTEAVQRLRSAELADEPGTEFHYHNPNYQVAARLIEVVSGAAYADYLREHVFSPLGMNDSTTVDAARDAKDVAHGYIRAYGIAIPADEPEWFVGGSHGVLSTAADLAKWLVVQNNGGATPEGRRIVSAEAVALMHTPAEPDDYGMGWRREQTGGGPVRISHKGDWFTYTAEQTLLPESGYGIAVIANTGLALEDDPAVIGRGLVALSEGATPQIRYPIGVYADWALAVATLGTLGVGVLALVRSRRWADRRYGRRYRLIALRQLPYLAPIPILVLLPHLAGLVFAGRSGTFTQVTYVWPALVIWLLVAALSGTTVLATRGIRLARLHR